MKKVASTFEEFGFSTTTTKGEGAAPYEATLVTLGYDEKDRPLILQILLFSQKILESFEDSVEPVEYTKMGILSFVLTNPIEVPENRFSEILRLVGLANKAIPFGYINLSEPEKATYYTYSLPIFSSGPEEIELMTVLQTALFVKDSFFPVIEEVANGKIDVAQLLTDELYTNSYKT
jgi:hypothetical protein